jgi:exodeoxyribonuclease-3
MKSEIRIMSYNVNGIRAALKKGFIDWLKETDPDILCLQEVKANPDQVNLDVFTDMGYHVYWNSAKKKGYSGVALLTKTKPDAIISGMGVEKYDDEGRVLLADYGSFAVISAYFPSGTSGDVRQDFKMEFLGDFEKFLSSLSLNHHSYVISGDYNICHHPIDIHDPVGNKKSSGFLPEEREWMTTFTKSGFIDTFRYFNKEPHQYTWWSFRHNAREKNKGWRIDYHMVSESMEQWLLDAKIHGSAKHSDHCPLELVIKNPLV